jgi:ATP-binding cassette subfamily F protein 2
MVCENKTVKKWQGTITDYKNALRKKMLADGAV